MNKNRYVFWAFWILLIIIGPITILLKTSISFALSGPLGMLDFLQRMTGVLAFTFLFFQIVLGAFLPKLTEKLGSWVFRFHLTEGAFAYALVLLHPLLFVLFNFEANQVLDPFYVFTDLCVLCRTRLEFYYTFGRTAFWLVSLAVLTAILRTHPLLRTKWRFFHILNYFAFILIALHAKDVGIDIGRFPFVIFFWFAVTSVLITSVYKLYRYLKA